MNNKRKTISLISGLVCVVITLVAMFSVVNTSVTELPIIKMALGESEIDQIDDYLDEIDDLSDEEIEEFEDETDVDFEVVEDLFKKPSINNIIKIGNIIDEYEPLGEEFDMLKLARTVVIVYALIIALFSLLGALLKKIAFPIVSIVISLVFYIFAAGLIWLVLFVVANVVHMVFISKEKKVNNTTI